MVGFLHTPISFLIVMQGAGTKGRPVVFFDVNVGDTPVSYTHLTLPTTF